MNAARRKALRALDFNRLRVSIESLKTDIEAFREAVEQVRDDEQEALDNMPESLQEGERGEAMNEAIEQLDTLYDALDPDPLDEITSALAEFEENFAW